MTSTNHIYRFWKRSFYRYDWLYIYDGVDILDFPRVATSGISANFNSSSLPIDIMRSSSPQLIIQLLSGSTSNETYFKIKLNSGKIQYMKDNSIGLIKFEDIKIPL